MYGVDVKSYVKQKFFHQFCQPVDKNPQKTFDKKLELAMNKIIAATLSQSRDIVEEHQTAISEEHEASYLPILQPTFSAPQLPQSPNSTMPLLSVTERMDAMDIQETASTFLQTQISQGVSALSQPPPIVPSAELSFMSETALPLMATSSPGTAATSQNQSDIYALFQQFMNSDIFFNDGMSSPSLAAAAAPSSGSNAIDFNLLGHQDTNTFSWEDNESTFTSISSTSISTTMPGEFNAEQHFLP